MLPQEYSIYDNILRKEKLPWSPGDHFKLDLIPLLCEEQHRLYQNMVGMAEWAVHIGRFDILYTINSLKNFLAAPRKGHLSRLVKIFSYLQSFTGRRKCIVVLSEDIEEIIGKVARIKY